MTRMSPAWQNSPLFVKMQHDPDTLSSFVDLLDVILTRDLSQLPKHILDLGGFPLC